MEALSDRLKTLAVRYKALGNDKIAEDYKVILRMLEHEATVDAVPVARCRDCASFEETGKYPTNRGGEQFGYCYHWQYEQGMSPNQVDGDDFCSYGERRNRK